MELVPNLHLLLSHLALPIRMLVATPQLTSCLTMAVSSELLMPELEESIVFALLLPLLHPGSPIQMSAVDPQLASPSQALVQCHHRASTF